MPSAFASSCNPWGARAGTLPQPPHPARCGAHAASKYRLRRHLSVFRGRNTRISPLRRVCDRTNPRSNSHEKSKGAFVSGGGVANTTRCHMCRFRAVEGSEKMRSPPISTHMEIGPGGFYPRVCTAHLDGNMCRPVACNEPTDKERPY